MVCLIKPQFEAGRDKVGKKGVVREPEVHREVVHKIVDYADMIGFDIKGLTYSPIKGPEGNLEYLLYIEKKAEIAEEITYLTELEVENALRDLVIEVNGRSYEADMKELITRIVAEAHNALDEVKPEE